jgi:hypothetical protein
MPNLAHWRRKHFERLEARQMLAGNVTAELVDGDLIVTGDAADNRIRIYMNAFGETKLFGDGTIVNGVPDGTFDLTHLTGDVVARLGDGNDVVNFEGGFPGAVVIEGGNGNDHVNSLAGGSIAAGLVIDVGSGANSVGLSGRGFGREGYSLGFRVGTSAIITGGAHEDGVSVEQVYVVNDLVINTGAGADRIDVRRSTIGQFLGIDSGADSDRLFLFGTNVSTASLQTGAGTASIDLEFFYARHDLGILAPDGATDILLWRSRVDGTAYVVGGHSNDYVKVEDSVLAAAQVYTGSGSDRLDVTGSILDRLFADLGGDNDWLLMTYTTVNDQATLIGGIGFDMFSRNGNALRRLQLGSFEA